MEECGIVGAIDRSEARKRYTRTLTVKSLGYLGSMDVFSTWHALDEHPFYTAPTLYDADGTCDVIELNEAFAAQSLACIRSWHLADDDPRINPNGGAIALGHPLGMTGARILLACAKELARRNGTYGLVTLCIGVGQGYAVVIKNCSSSAAS